MLRAGETEDYTVVILPGNPAASVDLDDMPGLMLYPNPPTGDINRVCSQLMEETVITNSLGQVDYFSTPRQATHTCHIEDNGIYFAKINVGNHMIVKKFVIAK